tara:strand:+ start:11633 stop:12505 length:873 start_codon:yes stop_codon:yes gene_type:complete
MIDWIEALEKVGIDVPLGIDEFSIKCPFHEDNVASCAINIDKGVWICFAGCGQGSLKTFLKKHLNYNDIQLTEVLTPKPSLSLDIFDDIDITKVDEEIEDVFIPDFIPNKFPKWIYDRGFTESILKFWGCGTNNWGDLIIPIHNTQNKLVGWVARRQKAIPKYMYSYKFQKSKVLFGAHKLVNVEKHVLCVTEGALDTMWLWQHGLPSVAILGATMSKEQCNLLRSLKIEEIVLCFDNDVAGQRAAEKATTMLSSSVLTSVIELPNMYKDVQEINNQALLKEVIANRSFF